MNDIERIAPPASRATASPAVLGRRLAERVLALPRRDLLIGTALVALAVRLPFIVGPSIGTLASDSGIYLRTAHDLLHGHGFATGGEIRTPGYPIFLALCSLLPGTTAGAAVTVQHLLGVALTVLLVAAAYRWFGRGAAVITALIAVTSPVLVDTEGDALPDFLFGALVVCGAVVLAQALSQDRPRLRLVAATGATFGVAALVKPAGQALFLVALVPLLAAPRAPRRGVREGVVLALCLLATISPWLIRNVVHYGDVRLSVQDGAALWLREFDWDQRPVPTTTADDRLARHLFEQTVGKSASSHPTNTYELVYVELVNHYGYSDREAMALQRRVALEAIRDAPGVYMHGTEQIAKHLTWFTHELYPARLGLRHKTFSPSLPAGPSLAVFDLGQRLVHLWWTLSLALLSALLLLFAGRKRRVGVLAAGGAWVAITLATSLTVWPDPRYAAEVVPLLWVVGSGGTSLVLTGLARVLRRPR